MLCVFILVSVFSLACIIAYQASLSETLVGTADNNF